MLVNTIVTLTCSSYNAIKIVPREFKYASPLGLINRMFGQGSLQRCSNRDYRRTSRYLLVQGKTSQNLVLFW